MSERFKLLRDALEVIEAGLGEELSAQDVADRCHCSLSTLQKIFQHMAHLGIADYIGRRRITLAARDLITTTDTVLDIALRYGYGSHEVFIRAFRRIWGETPSRFRATRSFSDIYPKYHIMEGEKKMSVRKNFDPAQLYDAMKGKENTIVAVFDTCHLSDVNANLGHAAGDLVIAESLRRLDAAKGEDMILLRIGGDEYALLTGLESADDAKELVLRVMADNGKPILYGTQEIPVSLRCTLTRIDNKELPAQETLINMIRLMEEQREETILSNRA